MTKLGTSLLVGAQCCAAALLAGAVNSTAFAGQLGELRGTFTGTTPTSAAQLFEVRRTPADPHNFSVGSFMIRPSLDVAIGGGYDDNLFASSSDANTDLSIDVSPELRMLSNWSRHSLEIIVGGDAKFFADHSTENQANGYIGATGTIDVQRDLTIAARAKFSADHEDRGEGESFPLFNSPIRSQTFDAGVSVNKRFNRMSVQVGASAQRSDFKDGILNNPSPLIPSVTVDQDFRDGWAYGTTARAAYEFSPLTSFFVQYAHNWRDYEGGAFDSNGYSVVGGVSYEFTRLLRGEFSAGAMGQRFDVAARKDIETYTFNGSILWDPTERANVTFLANRSIGGPSGFAGASSRIDSEVAVRVDYSIWKNLTFAGTLAYGWIEFVDSGRDDSITKGQVGFQYSFNHRLSAFMNYTYTTYDGSSIPNVDYDRDRVQAGVTVKLF